jgi:DNA polymerase I-like protein with 3'-5' exonuclease and polymerase domains
MFFDDDDITLRKRAALKVPPPIPDTGWRPPQYFPNLSGASIIGFDVETKENDWKHGPGWSRHKGHIVGFSVAARDRAGNRGKWYFPVRHEVEPDYNLDPRNCFGWLKETLEGTPHIPKVGANLIYDVGWLTEEGIYVAGELHDIQFAEALLNDQGEVALDHLGVKYLDRGKETSLLYEWLAKAYGGPASGIQRENIWRSPPRLAGPYGENDADMPIDILERQWPRLQQEGLVDLYHLEREQIRLLIRMRLTGVQIDVKVAEQLYVEIGRDTAKLYEQLYRDTGVRIESAGSPGDISRVFDSVGIEYPRTTAGNPSFRKEWLAALEHPTADLINSIREHEKIRSTFVRSYLLESNVNGRIYCQFHPLRGDDGGTITGRYSSSDPNLQNIPVRSKLGKKVRTAFIPDYGHVAWEKDDHSQIEYRMLAHNAVGPGADELRAEYVANPKTDYHERVFVRFAPKMGWNLDTMPKDERKEKRRPLKNVNFGLIYGQTEKSLAYKAGMKPEQAKDFFRDYHETAPYVRPTMKAIGQEVQALGHITTILNRRVRFNLWEPIDEKAMPLPYEWAIKHWGGRIRRAYAYRGVNYKFQGSAADALKKGIVDCYKAGVFDVIGVPKLQVHDELDFSVIDDTPAQREGYAYMRHLLENAVPQMRVPLRVDWGRAANWGLID